MIQYVVSLMTLHITIKRDCILLRFYMSSMASYFLTFYSKNRKRDKINNMNSLEKTKPSTVYMFEINNRTERMTFISILASLVLNTRLGNIRLDILQYLCGLAMKKQQ